MLGSKSCKLNFSSMCTENYQKYKLDFEEAEESKIVEKARETQEKKKKNLLCYTDYAKTSDGVEYNKL